MAAEDDKQRNNNFCLHSHTLHNRNSCNNHGKQRAFENSIMLISIIFASQGDWQVCFRRNVLEWTRLGASSFASYFGNSPSLSESSFSSIKC